ncbi:MAG: VOC family protein [Thermofilaceae archaeon]|nr:VOC family protein [Thermofilaceae archaeon]MCX8179857.1 VOC family protein [Thermofilaceae archaeon]MDW8004458.1 VOC family protein [Thermofilaceae archaeon]
MEEFKKITQVALVVRDIERVAEAWARLLGVEKPDVIETGDVEETRMEYKGTPSNARAKLAFFDLGGLTLELIQPVGEPSTWSEFLRLYGQGIHHIAFIVRDMESAIKELEKEGGRLVQKGDFTGGSYAYIDARESLGAIIELLTFNR